MGMGGSARINKHNTILGAFRLRFFHEYCFWPLCSTWYHQLLADVSWQVSDAECCKFCRRCVCRNLVGGASWNPKPPRTGVWFLRACGTPAGMLMATKPQCVNMKPIHAGKKPTSSEEVEIYRTSQPHCTHSAPIDPTPPWPGCKPGASHAFRFGQDLT